MHSSKFASLWLVAVMLVGCGGSSSDESPVDQSEAKVEAEAEAEADRVVNGLCDTPLPREVRTFTVTSPLANSFDPDRTPDALDSAVTEFNVAVLLPERCESDRFPVVIESHGYSGNLDSTIAADGEVDSQTPHFPAIDELFATLPYHDYVAVSFDERGHGESVPENGGGYARVIAPRAETQDARFLLDVLYDRAGEFHIETQDNTGVARDINVGLIGYSYGGGFQLGLSQLDNRVDTIVPNGTWHSLMHSLLPGDALKRSFTGLLCLLADTNDVSNTPAIARMCELVGSAGSEANIIRTRAELVERLETEGYTEAEVIELFDRHVRHLQRSAEAGQPWCSPGQLGCSSTGDAFEPRSVPALLLQGNRDVLFNLTEAYWNWQYFRSAAGEGVPVSVLTTEGGHMNPLASQEEGTANCGRLVGVNLILSWFDFHLKGKASDTYDSIPTVCISVADTENAHAAEPVGLVLEDFPVGSQTGVGGVPVREPSLTVEVAATVTDSVFVSLHTVAGDDQVLAGIPRMDRAVVVDTDAELPNSVTAVAYIGIGIQRGDQLILVDDEVTALVQGDHSSNPNIGEPGVLLAGVGEQLQNGDVVGLLVYPNHVQFSAVSNPGSAEAPNPFRLSAEGVEVPILDLSLHPTAFLQ